MNTIILFLISPLVDYAKAWIKSGNNQADLNDFVQNRVQIPRKTLDALTKGMAPHDKQEIENLSREMAEAQANFINAVASRGAILPEYDEFTDRLDALPQAEGDEREEKSGEDPAPKSKGSKAKES